MPKHERYLGTLESGAPLAIYADDPIVQSDDTPGLRVLTRTMHLPLKQFADAEKLEAEFEQHAARLNALRDSGGSDEQIRQETMLCKRAAMRADLARNVEGQTHRNVELQG